MIEKSAKKRKKAAFVFYWIGSAKYELNSEFIAPKYRNCETDSTVNGTSTLNKTPLE